uniref:Uncharacterized protein n=1 Tax=virus sp. ctDYl1 TaxID=2826795 RepID=A0A8S5RA31_9VIRU|nr:MAG TPA: hypothetical protein [virus sp. ctDYl1]
MSREIFFKYRLTFKRNLFKLLNNDGRGNSGRAGLTVQKNR